MLRFSADMNGLYRCNLSLKTTPRSSENRQKHSKHTTGQVFQTLFGFLGIFHGKPPIIIDRIALVMRRSVLQYKLVGHLNGFFAPRGKNLNKPIFKSSYARGVPGGFPGGDVELSN